MAETNSSKMTREEILALPAGRELDALIAVRIMGWEKVRGRTPGYSTDIAAAWQVVEKMHSMDLWLYFSVDAYGANAGFAKRSISPKWHWDVMGEPAPLAICRAALLAMLE